MNHEKYILLIYVSKWKVITYLYITCNRSVSAFYRKWEIYFPIRSNWKPRDFPMEFTKLQRKDPRRPIGLRSSPLTSEIVRYSPKASETSNVQCILLVTITQVEILFHWAFNIFSLTSMWLTSLKINKIRQNTIRNHIIRGIWPQKYTDSNFYLDPCLSTIHLFRSVLGHIFKPDKSLSIWLALYPWIKGNSLLAY